MKVDQASQVRFINTPFIAAFPWPASTGVGISCSPPLHIHPDIQSTVAAKQTADHNSNGIQDVFQTTVLELQKPPKLPTLGLRDINQHAQIPCA